MTKQLFFYETAMPVSFARHGKTSVKAGSDFRFAAEVNSVPLVASEFAAAATQFPIVFAGEGENVVPTVILGVEGARNAFLAEDGSWTGTYVPEFIRRYPFVFSHEVDAKKLVLHVDESYAGVNEEGRGEKLFDADGEQTQYLRSVVAFLQDFQTRFNRSQVFARRLAELDLLQPMRATFTLPSGETRTLTGFKTVNRDKLKALSDEDVLKMFRTDELECTMLHLFSLRHFADVAGRSTGAVSAAATVEGAEPLSEPAEVD